MINGADDRGRQCTASCSCSQAMISGSISCSAGCEATLCSAAASITRMQPALITGHCSDISYGGGIVLVSGMTLQHVSCSSGDMPGLGMAQFCKYSDSRNLVLLWSAVQTTEDCVQNLANVVSSVCKW